MFSIFCVKKFKNSSQVCEVVVGAGERGGFMMEFIVLKRILGIFECWLIIFEKCLALAALAADWKDSRADLKMSKETVRRSFFHLRSALRQACLSERVFSSSHDLDLKFERL